MARRFSITVPDHVWLALEKEVNRLREIGAQVTLPEPTLSQNGSSDRMAVQEKPSKSVLLLQALYLDDTWRHRIRAAAKE